MKWYLCTILGAGGAAHGASCVIKNDFCQWLTNISSSNKEKYVYRLPTLNEAITSSCLRDLDEGFWCLNNRKPYLAGLSKDNAEVITSAIKVQLAVSLQEKEISIKDLCQFFNFSFDGILHDSHEMVYRILDIINFRSANLLSLKDSTDTACLIHIVRAMRSNLQRHTLNRLFGARVKSSIPNTKDWRRNKFTAENKLNDTINEPLYFMKSIDRFDLAYQGLGILTNRSCRLNSEYEVINRIMSIIRTRSLVTSKNDPSNFEATSLLIFIIVLLLAHSGLCSSMRSMPRPYLWMASGFGPDKQTFLRLMRRHSLELMEALVCLSFRQAQVAAENVRHGHIKLVRQDAIL